VELAVADDPFARQSAVEEAVDQAFLNAVRDGAGTALPEAKRASRAKARRAHAPN